MSTATLEQGDKRGAAPRANDAVRSAHATDDAQRGYPRQRIDAACEAACRSIAPAWPLDRAIAVNPHWERIGRPVREVAARMAVLADIKVFPPRDRIRSAWESGRIAPADLQYALQALPAAQAAGMTERTCIDALTRAFNRLRLPLLIDVLDDDPFRHERLSWRQAITHQVSQTCAAYFDEHQADWRPHHDQSLYAFWRDTIAHDHGIGALMGLPRLGQSLKVLPHTRQDAESWVLERLDLPEAVWPDYLEAVLLTVNGWASWCAYLGWQARLLGESDAHLRDLLAIRLAWGALLLDCKDDAAARRAFAAVQGHWRDSAALLADAQALLLVDEVWQLAFEAGYQRELASKLGAIGQPRTPPEAAPQIEVQAAFCIDVRSEPLRRAVESIWPAVQTIGFAGFFGLPVAYTPLATSARRPQLPGLLAPSLEVTDAVSTTAGQGGGTISGAASKARRARFALSNQASAATRLPGTSFSFVEAAGLGYLGKMRQWLKPSQNRRVRDDLAGLPNRYKALCRPTLAGIDGQAKVDLAARILHGMGIERSLAPLVVLIGHASQSANNAHAAALDCGACCGQSGEVNARVLAQVLNDRVVRAGLKQRGIDVPDETTFVAALHNTTTDEIEGFDLDLLSPIAAARWDKLLGVFGHACDQVRRERAARLGLDPRMEAGRLLASLRERANDGAQTRPEWGLAGNAAFVIAPRNRSHGAVLDGRCFLHDYDFSQDTDGSLLELLMTAPMLVAHWINWQYHASTCDPMHMGCGNKVLHNVVGGHIGVFEGNSGDLRIGLSKQSLHDGRRWIHEPLRLTVIIDAPGAAIERVIDRHPAVRQLIQHGWLHLWRFSESGLLRFGNGTWHELQMEAVQ
ncbi:YbcC family protein [Burkholderia thailandensis]|nr:DUF2309 domain-containing protein [Burkholderia thailandensis]AHI63733.1 hypothetical protein BTL_2029 [Burkholderia thailandensis H0587]AIP61821.1 hypothetical protein DR62_2882 [Burkholderia thailandensis]AOI51913.1 hypothetical protein WI24_08925 [Burkholderia thailandensis]AOJ50918.1 hypothetical protein AQ475_08830 [Burkholderia thailandensis]AVR26345.1 DUF2309 domain-containing protein [Burkholderia thailandensis]